MARKNAAHRKWERRDAAIKRQTIAVETKFSYPSPKVRVKGPEDLPFKAYAPVSVFVPANGHGPRPVKRPSRVKR